MTTSAFNQFPVEYQSLLTLFNSIYQLSPQANEDIVGNSKVITVQKKTDLLRAGEISNNIYFIVQGSARNYHLNKDGEETTSWFLFENELLISVYSFFTGAPGFEYLRTMEDSILIVLSKEKLDFLYQKHIEFNFIGRKLTEQYYVRNEAQTNDLRMLTSKQRYEKLIAHQPHLLNRVPLGYIASYLGISQETLSRIRRQK